jgi:hypothetical protein
MNVPGFIAAQLCGAAAATALFRWLVPSLPKDASNVLVPHTETDSIHEVTVKGGQGLTPISREGTKTSADSQNL